MTEPTRADQIEHLANRLRALLDDCWDAGVQVLHHPEPDADCCAVARETAEQTPPGGTIDQ